MIRQVQAVAAAPVVAAEVPAAVEAAEELTDSEAVLSEEVVFAEQPVSAVAAARTAARMSLDDFMLCSFLSGTRGTGALKKPSSKGKGHDKTGASNGAGKSYDQYLVIRDPIPVHSDGRFPGLRIIAEYRLPGFPVAEEELRGFCSPDTVTRSCRIRTCFPFTLSHDCSCCGTALLIQF